MSLIALALLQPLLAAPHRAPPTKPAETAWVAGLERQIVIVKMAEPDVAPVAPVAPAALPAVPGAVVTPLFPRAPAAIRADRAAFDPERRLADLTRYYRVSLPPDASGPSEPASSPSDPSGAEGLCDRLNARADVEIAYLAFAPAPPPVDLDPVTPDFEPQQGYLGPAPGGFGIQEAANWPGGDGANVAIADLEYSWDPEHEDLSATVDITTWGYDVGAYAFHGNAVLGELVAGDDGYGVTGIAPAAEPLVIFPYVDRLTYSIAAAVDAATALLEAGDVLLIEQQVQRDGVLLPVSADAATFDAIALAVAKGIVVVEPGANGGADLDSPVYGGWFDRSVRDSGAIMVGGGASPSSGLTPRSYYSSGTGSSYGSRVDVQGWYDNIVTATTWEFSPDLYFPDSDSRQAYTSYFGGTSGASPMVAGVAAIAQSVAIAVHGQPFAPEDLRALMITTGTPQAPTDSRHIGPQPDLRGLLRAGLVP